MTPLLQLENFCVSYGQVQALHGVNLAIAISSSEQAQVAFRRELAKYAALVRKVGLEPQ